MTDDQQFILAIVTLIVPTAAATFATLQTRKTHQAVNGMLAKGTRRARAQGRAQGQKDVSVGKLPTGEGNSPTAN
jgi:hypothetical protein